jgi:sugar/nucleoside kinase (ribokinase family)
MGITAIGSMSKETIKTGMGQVDNIAGGELMYFALASKILSNTSLISAVGYDYAKDKTFTKDSNINFEGLSIIKEKESATHYLVYKEDLYKPVKENKNFEIFDEFPFENSLENEKPDFLYVGELKFDTQNKILTKTTPMKIKTMTVIPSMEIKVNPNSIKKVLKSSYIVLMDDEDIVSVNKNNNIVSGARNIFPTKGVEYLIILNKLSVMLLSKFQLSMLPVYPVEKIIDTTGYKYAFAGAFLSYVEHVKKYDFDSMAEALMYANIVSSFCVEGLGVNGFLNININRIIDRYEEYKAMVYIPEINSKIIE